MHMNTTQKTDAALRTSDHVNDNEDINSLLEDNYQRGFHQALTYLYTTMQDCKVSCLDLEEIMAVLTIAGTMRCEDNNISYRNYGDVFSAQMREVLDYSVWKIEQKSQE